MKAVIMAGGYGTRLRPVTGDRPKPMADVLGRPIMEHIVRHLKDCGFDEICAALKYRAGDIMAHFGDGRRFGVRMDYSIETEPLGTAGAVKKCADFYGQEDFLVISADAACDFRLDKLMAAHKSSGAAVSIALQRNPRPLRYGLALQDGQGFVRAFIEKPGWERVVTDMVNTGIYVISPRVMELLEPGQVCDFGRELFPRLIARGEKILGLEMEGYWRDMGTPADYFRCCADAWEGRWKLHPAAAGGGSRQDGASADAPLPQTRVQREGQMRQGGEETIDPAAAGGNVSTAETPLGSQKEPLPLGGESAIVKGDCEKEGVLIPVADRAGVMGIVSAELMELGADYERGLSLTGPRFSLWLRPAADVSALRLSVSSPDAVLAGHMLTLARDMVEKLAAG